MIVIAVLLLAAVPVAWFVRAQKRHGLGPLAWRWFSGHALDGHHRTNATWLHRSTVTLHPTPVVRWHHWPRLHRAGVRTVSTFTVFLLLYGLAAARTVTLAVLAAAAFVLAALAAWRAWYLGRRWNHHRRYVRPLRRALIPALSGPPPRLAIEPDRSRVKIWLPEEFTGSPREQEDVTRAVTAKVAIEAPDTEWHLDRRDGRKPCVIYTRGEPPPAVVLPAGIRAEVEAAAEHEVIMGIGRKGQITAVSVDNDSPHVGLSMGSGDGKSVTARNMAVQLLYHGALVVVLDLKLISHMWARGLPNVAYAGTPDEIEAVMVWLAGEVTRRNRVALAGADIEGRVHADVGPRIFVICEELNATQNRLKAWWNQEMEMKGRSPGSMALDEVMFLGRQVLVNVLQIGQRLSVKATGSGDARENLGVLIFADPTASAWKMLVGDRHVLPPASGHKGRLQVVTKKTVREAQGVFWTGQQAHDFALSGAVAVPPAGMPCVSAVAPVALLPELAPGGSGLPFVVRQGVPVVPRPPDAVTLREAADAGLFVSKSAAARAVQRAQLEDAGQLGSAKLYRLADLAVISSQRVRIS